MTPGRSTARFALLLAGAAAAWLPACGGMSSRTPATRVVVKSPTLPAADAEAVRDLEAGLRALRLGGPEAGLRAEARLRSAVQRDPRLWEAWHDLGVVLFGRGEDGAAAEAFGRALAINPAHTPALLARAEAFRRAGELDKARADYEEVLRRDPDDVHARARTASLLRQAGELDEALDVLREALRRTGGSSAIHLELGLIYLAQGRDELAELVLSKAAALDQKNPAIYNALALVSMERHRDQEAFARFDRATAVDPGYLDARFNVASVLIDAGDYARARTELEAVVERRPDDFGAIVALGVAYRGSGEHKKARELWEDVVKAAPTHSMVRADALFNLAALDMDFVMDEKSALAALDRFLQESPANHPKRREAEERRKELGQ